MSLRPCVSAVGEAEASASLYFRADVYAGIMELAKLTGPPDWSSFVEAAGQWTLEDRRARVDPV